MQKTLLLLITLTLLPLPTTAQTQLSGTVTDATTNQPVAFATVYLDGTSSGDITADDGTFTISVTTDRRPLSLVISHLNYENRALAVADPARPLSVHLQPGGNELTQIQVADVNQRKKNLREFRNRMFGTDDWGLNVELLNEEVLRFDRDLYSDSTNRFAGGPRIRIQPAGGAANDGFRPVNRARNLKAKSQDALRLELPDLGYTLRLDLVDYLSDYPSGQMSYLGTSFFREIPTTRKSVRKRYLRNRHRAYYGSQLHFIRSLVADSLNYNGFQVVEILNPDAIGVDPVTQPIFLKEYLTAQPDGSYRLSGLKNRTLAILYYFDTGYKPLPPWRRLRSSRPLQSRLLFKGDAVLYPDGTSGNTNLVFSGDIGSRGLGWWLPSDFQPGYD